MADYTAKQFDEEGKALEKKLFDRELELLKKMSPEKLKAQAQLELSMIESKDPNAPVEYYPNQDYVKKNLKPENVPMGSLRALAAAQRTAEKAGVLSKDAAQYMLANALVEGRPNDFGVNENIYPGSNPRVKDIVKRMGVEHMTQAPKLTAEQQSYLKTLNLPTPYKEGDIVIKPKEGDPKGNAKLAATMFAIKASQTSNAEDAIRAWNGKGPATDLHLAKVKEAHRMLQDPKNAAVIRAYQRALQYSDEE